MGIHDESQEPHVHWDASRVLELELEARDQERIAITKLVEQAHHLIQGVIDGALNNDTLTTANHHLANASKLLRWPLPFDLTSSSATPTSDAERAELLKQIDDELNLALADLAEEDR